MAVEDLIKGLYSDDDYQKFILETMRLFALGLLTDDEVRARMDAIKKQVGKQ